MRKKIKCEFIWIYIFFYFYVNIVLYCIVLYSVVKDGITVQVPCLAVPFVINKLILFVDFVSLAPSEEDRDPRLEISHQKPGLGAGHGHEPPSLVVDVVNIHIRQPSFVWSRDPRNSPVKMLVIRLQSESPMSSSWKFRLRLGVSRTPVRVERLWGINSRSSRLGFQENLI